MSQHGFTSGLLTLPFLPLLAAAQGGNPPPLIGNFPNVVAPSGNPTTNEKVLLGFALFFEEQLSSDDTMACATCHLPEAGGGDPRAGMRAPGDDGLMRTADDEFGSPGMVPQDQDGNFREHPAFGFGLQATGRNSPPAINAAFLNTQFWDRRAGPVFRDLLGNVVLPDLASLEAQAVEPPLSSIEMGDLDRTWSEITTKLERVRPLHLAVDVPPRLAQFLGTETSYGPLFTQAFGSPEITRERIGMAIASYERTLVSDQSPFDLGTLTPLQQQGFFAYQNRANCENCHPSTNRLFTTGEFEDIRLQDHRRRVKVPSLRNVGLRPRFMSSGQFRNMDLVLQHYEGLAFFRPLTGDGGAVKDFLVNGLTDPRVANRQFPFDRPTLRSDIAPSGSNLFGTGTRGSNRIVPLMLADSPPSFGSPSFQLGIGATAGDAKALLVLSPRMASAGTTLLGIPLSVDPVGAIYKLMITSRAGPGHGVATYRMPLPTDLALIGRRFYAQWLVRDRGAASGIAATRAASFTLFARP
jgi:cytochrome c peroxidase